MVRAGHGTVVTISSWLALAGIAGRVLLRGGDRKHPGLHQELRPRSRANGVRVNCIAVGPLHETTRTTVHVTPDEVADTVMFLVNDGDFFVGQVLSPAAGAVV